MKRLYFLCILNLLTLPIIAQEWETVAFMPMSFDVTQIHVVNENNIVVASEHYKLLQWNGEEWNPIGDYQNSFGIPHFHYLADDDIYATKNDYLNGNEQNFNYIAHWNGVEWSNAHNLNVPKPINKIHVVNDNEIYAVGEFTLPQYRWKPVAKYSDGVWSVVGMGDSQAGSYSTYSSLWVNNENDLYSTSGYSDAGVIRIKHWNGESWEVFYHYQLDEAQRLSHPVPGDNGSLYAFGYKVETGESCIVRWNGEYWEILGNIEEELNTHNFAYNSRIYFEYVSENEIYAVGGKFRDADSDLFKVVKWNGENWSELGSINANAAALSMDIHAGYLYVSGGFVEASPNGNKSVIKRFYIGENTESFEVQAIAEPAEGGNITGSGFYESSEWVQLTATPNENYSFLHWKENEEIVSEDEVYEFQATENRNLVAHFSSNLSLIEHEYATIQWYPNPTKDEIYFKNPDLINFEVSIYDMTGGLVFHRKINNQPSPKINLSYLKSGNYIINILTDGKVINSKNLLKN